MPRCVVNLREQTIQIMRDMKKLNLLLIALLCCVIYSCSKDNDEPIYVSYLSGTFTPGGKYALVATVDGVAVTSGEAKLTVNPEKQTEGVLTLNNIVSGYALLSVDVSIEQILVNNVNRYKIEGTKTVDGKTVDCGGILAAETYYEAERTLTLAVTVK